MKLRWGMSLSLSLLALVYYCQSPAPFHAHSRPRGLFIVGSTESFASLLGLRRFSRRSSRSLGLRFLPRFPLPPLTPSFSRPSWRDFLPPSRLSFLASGPLAHYPTSKDLGISAERHLYLPTVLAHLASRPFAYSEKKSWEQDKQ